MDAGWPLPALIRAVPVARLTRTHRQAQGSPILKLAGMLIGGERPCGTGVSFVQTPSTQAVVTLAGAHLDAGGRPLVILCAGMAGALGTVALNAALQAAFNPGGGRLRPGDPVVISVNDRTTGLMNGMTGVIVEGQKNALVTEFDGALYTFPGAAAGVLGLAYALTIHRAQGSEWPGVVVCLSLDHARLLSRRLAYTAVTRAQQTLVACGERAAWNACAETGVAARSSRLEERLRQ